MSNRNKNLTFDNYNAGMDDKDQFDAGMHYKDQSNADMDYKEKFAARVYLQFAKDLLKRVQDTEYFEDIREGFKLSNSTSKDDFINELIDHVRDLSKMPTTDVLFNFAQSFPQAENLLNEELKKLSRTHTELSPYEDGLLEFTTDALKNWREDFVKKLESSEKDAFDLAETNRVTTQGKMAHEIGTQITALWDQYDAQHKAITAIADKHKYSDIQQWRRETEKLKQDYATDIENRRRIALDEIDGYFADARAKTQHLKDAILSNIDKRISLYLKDLRESASHPVSAESIDNYLHRLDGDLHNMRTYLDSFQMDADNEARRLPPKITLESSEFSRDIRNFVTESQRKLDEQLKELTAAAEQAAANRNTPHSRG